MELKRFMKTRNFIAKDFLSWHVRVLVHVCKCTPEVKQIITKNKHRKKR